MRHALVVLLGTYLLGTACRNEMQKGATSWQEKHRKVVHSMPRDIREAHDHSSNNRQEVQDSSMSGCFYCLEVFKSSEVVDWVDEDSSGQGQTALCPRCGIDSVVGDKAGYPLSAEFLGKMKAHWF